MTPSGSQQTAESDSQVPPAAETIDPLFYPSWYKAQPRPASSPSSAPESGLGKVSPETSAKKAEAPKVAAVEESAPGSGKESNATAATSKVSATEVSPEGCDAPRGGSGSC